MSAFPEVMGQAFCSQAPASVEGGGQPVPQTGRTLPRVSVLLLVPTSYCVSISHPIFVGLSFLPKNIK